MAIEWVNSPQMFPLGSFTVAGAGLFNTANASYSAAGSSIRGGEGGNFISTASSSAQLLRSTVIQDGGYFHGQVYELFVVPSFAPPGGGGNPEPHPILHRIARYAKAKYGIG